MSSIRRFYSKILEFREISLAQGLHFLGRVMYQASGYRWEVRQSGDLKLGYWCKVLRKRNSRHSYPKRFVLVPGFGDSPLSWHGVILLLYPILKKRFDEIVLIDFPGFSGFLSQEKSFPSMDFMMKMFNDTMDSLKPHTILGHSLGGWLTVHYSGEFGTKKRVSAHQSSYEGPAQIFLVNPSGVFDDRSTREVCEALFKAAVSEGFDVLRPHLFAKEPSWFSWVSSSFSKFISREDIHQFIHSIKDEHDAQSIVPHIKAKVWLVWGKKDTLIPVSCARAWINCLNSKEIKSNAIILNGVGHSPHIENPAAIAAVLGQIIFGKVPHRIGKRWWTVLGAEPL